MLSGIPGIDSIIQARNVIEAKDSINSNMPDVMTLDIRMPDGNGIEVLKEVKQNKKAPVVIVLTNYPYPQLQRKCLEEGANYFFDKSDNYEGVLEIIANLAGNSNS